MNRFTTGILVAGVALATLQAGCAADSAVEDGEQAESAEDALTRAQCRGPVGETEEKCRLKGVVEKVFVGEIDSKVVGHACVTFVKVGARRYGLVKAPNDSCPDADRFDGAKIEVSFSKGALDLSSRSRAKVLKEHDANAIYYEFSGTLRESLPDGLAAFDALSDDAKVAFLYEALDGETWAELRPGFLATPIRIVDTQTGAALQRALAAYRPIASFSYANGGDQPKVVAVQENGVTYAYSISAYGHSAGSWARLHVYDRAWNEFARFQYED